MQISSRIWGIINLTFLFVIFGLSLYNASHFFTLSILYLDYPFEIDWGEGPNVLFFDQLQHFGHFYFDINTPPYSYATYPPVFFLAQKILSLFISNPLLSGRALSILFTFALFMVLFKICYRIFNRYFLAALFALQFLGIWFVAFWAPLNRVDSLACFFEVLGLYSFLKNNSARHWHQRVLPVFWFVLAFLTKQNMIFGFAASLITLILIQRNFSSFFLYSATYLLCLLTTLGWLEYQSQGEALKHLFLYTANRDISLGRIIFSLKIFLSTLWILVSLSISFLQIEKMLRSNFAVIWIYWILTWCFIIMIGSPEANLNYLMPGAAATVLCAALAGHFWTHHQPFSSWKIGVLLLLVFTQALTLWYWTAHLTQRAIVIWDVPGYYYRYHESSQKKAAALIQNSRLPILSENISALVLNHKPIAWGPPRPIRGENLAPTPQKILQACEREEYGGIIAGPRLLDRRDLKECLGRNYELIYRSKIYLIYKKKGPTST